MPHHKLVYRIFNLAALLSILFNFIQPVLVAYAQPEVTSAPSLAAPLAPSELAKNWPKVQAAEHQLPVPFLDPTSLALERALGGVIEADLVGSSPTRLEPLTSPTVPLVVLPIPGDSVPAAPDSLAQSQPTLPQAGVESPLSVTAPQPENPLGQLNPAQPAPSDVSALAEAAKVQGEDEAETAETDPLTQESTPPQTTPPDNFPAKPVLDLTVTQYLPTVNTAGPATVPNTVGAATGEVTTTLYLPIISNSGDNTPPPPPTPNNPTPTDVITMTTAGGTLISTDGLIRVIVPANATDEPFVLRYFAPPTGTGRGPSGVFTLEATTLTSKPVTLKRAAQLSMRLPDHRSGRPLFFRQRAAEQARTVSVGAYVVTNTIVMPGNTVDGEMLSAPIYEFGQFTFASLFPSALAYQGGRVGLMQLPPDENPDEGDDGLVITKFCTEQGTQGADYTFAQVTVYTSTQEADPWAYLDIFWPETINDENGNPTVTIVYDDNNPYLHDDSKLDFSNEPEVVLGYEEIGSYQPGKVLSFTAKVDDFGGPPDDNYRYDYLEDGSFQAGFKGCVNGNCNPNPPQISGVYIWQSGKDKGQTTGTAVITIAATVHSGTPAVSLKFNGQDYAMQLLDNGMYGVKVSYPVNQMNSYEVTVTDGCGNTTSLPAIEAHGSDSGNLGWAACDKCGGYQYPSTDPVNTANGNFYGRMTDVTVAGVGNTDLVIERAYNSMATLWPSGVTMRYTPDGSGGYKEEPLGPPQYFGPGWTFPYAVYLNAINAAPLYSGVQIQYADGHTVNFVEENGAYKPTSPASFDTLTKEGETWVLRHKRTLEAERFNTAGQLITKEDRNGNQIIFTYDGQLLKRAENGSGRWLEFDYTPESLIQTIRAPEGKSVSYSYTNGLLTGFSDGNGHTTIYAYDTNKQLTTITTPKGHTSLDQTYDEKYRVDWQKIGRAEINAFAYSADSLMTTMSDSYSHTTTYTYNNLGQIIKVTDDLGYSEEFDYDADYNRTYFKDREGREYTYTYDDRGNRKTEDGPLGQHREWDYNDLDLVTTMAEKVNSAGLTRETRFDYDSHGNLTLITNALGATSTLKYDGRGLPTNVFDFNGNETVNSYNPTTGDLTQTRNGAGDTVKYSYDGLGRVRTMTDGIDATYTYTYDDNDNLTDVDGPLGYHLGYRYDKNDNLEKEIDPNGGETDYIYDQSEKLVKAENQLDFPTVYTYDDMNNLIRLKDAEERVWTYDYDAVYNRIAEQGPEDTHTFYAYNKVRHVTDITRCNGLPGEAACARTQVTHFEYDDLDRVLTQIENYKPGQGETPDTNVTTTYEHDLAGHLLKLTDANYNATLYEYDLLDRLTRQEDAEQQVTRYGYDKNGNLISLINPREYETTFTYDGANRLKRTTDALLSQWQYDYDGNGNLTDTTDPLLVVTHNSYNALSRLESVTQNYRPGEAATPERNVTTRFEYDLAGNLRFVYDPRGNYVTEHRYDPAHRRILTIDNEKGETEFKYDKVNNLTHLIDPNDHDTEFVYDGLNRRTAVINPEQHQVSFTYDRLGNLLTLTDARHNPTTFTYDGMNRPTLRVDALQGQWRTEYDARGNVIRQLDANDHANNTYTYDKVYRVKSSIDAEEYVTRFAYDKNGNVESLTDGNDHTTTYTYDKLDRLESLTNAETETTRYQYDPLGNQTHLIEADEVVTLYTYDPLYRLSSVIQNNRPGQPAADTNVETHYGYDQVGNLLTITDAEEHQTHFSYDGLNRLVKEVDANTNTWDYEYDGVNRIARVDALRHRTTYSYYPDNQLHQIDYYDGTSVIYTYDENNNRLTMVDHLGTTTWRYDALNRVTDVTDSFNRHLGYTYDPVSNRTGLTYPDGRTVGYAYYKNNWLRVVTDPENNQTVYERDGVGQPLRVTNPNSTVSDLTYDKANRLLTLRNYQVGGAGKVNSAFSYTYDEVSQRTQMVAEYGWRNPPVVTSNYTYDKLRRLIRDADSEGVWTEYSFDRVGNRLTLRTNDDSQSPRPFDEQTLTYSYNAINQLLTVVGDTHPGQPNTKQEDNTAQTLHAFRHEVAAQASNHISQSAADTLLAMADSLLADLYGNPAPKQGEVTTALADLRNQVMAARDSGAIDSDGIENSLLVKLDWGDKANTGVSGDLQTATFTYDANGNRINKEFPGPQGPKIQGTDYAYDPENRLVTAQDYQGNSTGNRIDRAITTLAYDGDGRRLIKEYDPKTGGGGTKRTEYVFDGLDPVAEYNTQNNQYDNFYRGDLGRILTMQHFPSGSAGQMFWFHYDGLGSVSGLTKQSGQSTHNYRYEAYGQIEMPPGNFTDPHNHYTFTGQEWDEHLGQYEFFARKYDRMVGVWTTQDVYRGSVREPRTLHRYGYVYGDPTNYIDYYGFDGYLTIYANGSGLIDGHAWISYKASDGTVTSYGTWGNNPNNKGNGLLENYEKDNDMLQNADASRTLYINDDQEKKLNDIIQDYKDRGEGGWKLFAPCSAFAQDVWYGVTGEYLNANTWIIVNNPATLKKSIIEKNEGQNHYSPNQQYDDDGDSSSSNSSSNSSGQGSRSSGESSNSSGSSLGY